MILDGEDLPSTAVRDLPTSSLSEEEEEEDSTNTHQSRDSTPINSPHTPLYKSASTLSTTTATATNTSTSTRSTSTSAATSSTSMMNHKGRSSGNLLDLYQEEEKVESNPCADQTLSLEHPQQEGQQAAATTSENIPPSNEQQLLPKLNILRMNGRAGEQHSLQTKKNITTKHEPRPSFLDQFPDLGDQEDSPLFLEEGDESDYAHSPQQQQKQQQQHQQQQLKQNGSQQDAISNLHQSLLDQSIAEEEEQAEAFKTGMGRHNHYTKTEEHPLLRRRHVSISSEHLPSKMSSPAPLSSPERKTTILQKPCLSPRKHHPNQNSPPSTSTKHHHHHLHHHHQKTKSMLDEEMDYYPQPEDFPTCNNIHLVPSTIRTDADTTAAAPPPAPSLQFIPYYTVTKLLQRLSKALFVQSHQYSPTNNATWIGFWAMFLVTCSNYVLMPMRDAIALAVGVEHIPKLTLASTVLAFGSSVPIGWLFEAPDPSRQSFLKNIGLTRGETQGTSLALFYRFFALSLWSYAIGFLILELIQSMLGDNDNGNERTTTTTTFTGVGVEGENGIINNNNSRAWIVAYAKVCLSHVGQVMYVAFFLVVHLCKLHSLSLVWGVTTETMEYEETERKRSLVKQQREEERQQQLDQQQNNGSTTTTTTTPAAGTSSSSSPEEPPSTKLRLQRLAFVGFGGTVGGILGSILASTLARFLRLSGLLVVSALMLEAAAQLAIELGRIMHAHWVHQQLFPSSDNLESLDPSMKRSVSLGSMKRISSTNSLNRVKSLSELKRNSSHGSFHSSLTSMDQGQQKQQQHQPSNETIEKEVEVMKSNEDSFSQRLLRGIRTILQSRLLMAIFTYNALYASTTTLLSFQRAELVANRQQESNLSNESNTAFLANVNMASSVAVFALQASGLGAYVAHKCGSRGTLALMPMVRLLGVLTLAYWHHSSDGEPPNLLLFLMLDEFCRVMNMAVAKPVRESLWRGLSNEARYEAKPIVDTLANRWGGGSAAFLVSSIHRLLDLFGVPEARGGEIRVVFGFPPVLFLCMIVAAWWAGVSADLGHIRKRIDMELKKMQ